MKLKLATCVLSMLLFSVASFAQQTSVINGVVTDESGTPLPGVVVSIESPALQGTRSAVSKENGQFLFRLIPPGEYTLTATMPGMQTTKLTIPLGLGQTSRPSVVMSPEATAEELVVTATADPVLDTTEVTAHFSSDFVDKLANGRDQNNIALMAPGTSEAGPRGAVAIGGAQTYDNLFLLNGGNTNFDNLRGRPANIVIEDAIQETTVLTGAVSAEYGQFLGGVVNTITKSGGNEFSGAIRAALDNNDWIARNPLELESETERDDDINNILSLTVGGPIIKDRLWFFLAGRRQRGSRIQSLVAGNPLSDTLATRLGLPTGQTAPGVRNVPGSETSDDRYEIKLTGQIVEGHEVIFSYMERESETTNSTSFAGLGLGYVNPLRSDPQELMTINYRGLITPEFSLDFLYTDKQSTFAGTEDRFQGDIRESGTLIRDRSTLAYYNSYHFAGAPDEERDNKSLNLKASYFLTTESMGSHDIVLGYQDLQDVRKANNKQSASDWVFWTYTRFEGDQPIPVFSGGQNGTSATFMINWPIENLSQGSDFTTNSLYINDNWTLNDKWRFNVGFRYDKNDAFAEDGRPVSDDESISPRLSVEYDLRGDGRHKFSASYSQYVSRLSDAGQAASTAGSPSYIFWFYGGPITESIADVFQWFDDTYGAGASLDLFGPAGAVARANASGNGLFDPTSPDTIIGNYDPETGTITPGTLDSPKAIEYRIGYSTRWGTKAFLKADFVLRDYSDFYVQYANQQIGQTVNGFNELSIVDNEDSLYERNYHAVQLQGSYQFTENFAVFGNYTWAQTYGNVEAETVGSGSVTLSALTSYPEYGAYDQYNTIGPLSTDLRHNLRLFAVYDLHTSFGDFNFSATQRFQSGSPYASGISLDFQSFGGPEAFGLPAYSTTNYVNPPTSAAYSLSPRGSLRAEDMTQTDLGVNYEISFGRFDFFMEADILNIFNESAATFASGINTTVNLLAPFNVYTETPVEGTHYEYGSNFGTATSGAAYQRTRTFTIDFGVRF